jgi:hypothetical protein
MVRAYITSAVAGAFLLSAATVALAVTGEYSNLCTMGLALGKDIQTDCSINAQLQGKTYCCSKEAMAEFMKNPNENLAKAQAYYSKKLPGKLELLNDGRGPFLLRQGPPATQGISATALTIRAYLLYPQ